MFHVKQPLARLDRNGRGHPAVAAAAHATSFHVKRPHDRAGPFQKHCPTAPVHRTGFHVKPSLSESVTGTT